MGIQGTDRLPGQAVWAMPQPGILALMLHGLVSLGPVREVRPELLQPEIIPQMPLWGNPLLQLELRQDQRTVKWQLDDQDPTTLHAQLQARKQEQRCGFGYWVGTPGLTVSRLQTFARCSTSCGAFAPA